MLKNFVVCPHCRHHGLPGYLQRVSAETPMLVRSDGVSYHLYLLDGPTMRQDGGTATFSYLAEVPNLRAGEVCVRLGAVAPDRSLLRTTLHQFADRIAGHLARGDTPPEEMSLAALDVQGDPEPGTAALDAETGADQPAGDLDKEPNKSDLIRHLLRLYLSEDVAEQIVSDPDRHLELGGATEQVTVLFGDLRGFTGLSEILPAEEVLRFLNHYLTRVVDSVLEFAGMIDKFRGDGFMAVFRIKEGSEDPARRAVRCALQIRERLDHLPVAGKPGLNFGVGIGINTGSAISGTLGSRRRMDFTVGGDTVNTAQRLENMAGPGQIMLSAATYQEADDLVQAQDLGEIRLQGKQQFTRVFHAWDRAFSVPSILDRRAAREASTGRRREALEPGRESAGATHAARSGV